MVYAFNLKAWQWVRSSGSTETLVLTNTGNRDFDLAQAVRYFLEDYPTEVFVKVTMTGLQRKDVGLYQCVACLSPDSVMVLHYQIRLVQCQGELQWTLSVGWGLLLNSGQGPPSAALRRQLRLMGRVLELSFSHCATLRKSYSLCLSFCVCKARLLDAVNSKVIYFRGVESAVGTGHWPCATSQACG